MESQLTKRGTEQETDAFRDRARGFVSRQVPAGWLEIGALDGSAAQSFRAQVRAALAERGWLAPAWPVQYGVLISINKRYKVRSGISLAGIDHSISVSRRPLMGRCDR